MAKKTIDPLKAKQRKQKIMAIVLGVVFLGVAAFQVPRVMKMMKTPPNPHANDVTTTTADAHRHAVACRPDASRRRGPERRDDGRTHRLARVVRIRPRAGRPACFLQPLLQQGSVLAAAERRAPGTCTVQLLRLRIGFLRVAGSPDRRHVGQS